MGNRYTGNPVSTMAGQAASRAAIDTQLYFRQRSTRKPKRVWIMTSNMVSPVNFCHNLRDSQFIC